MKIKEIISNYKWKFSFTLFLLLLEAGIALLFPLFIGYAIDDALQEEYFGSMLLGGLGVAGLIVGAGRRFFDSRFYAQVFERYGVKIISKIQGDHSSVKTARLGMIREIVDFLENILPELISSIIGLAGVLVIIATINLKVFLGSLIASVLIFVVYWFSSNKTVKFNKHYNDEIERQVDVITQNDDRNLKHHLKSMMKWNIKLSDLETLNFSVSWLVLMTFLVLSIIISISDGVIKYGALFSLIMYVFQYMESIINLPFFYQNWLRLTEIKERLGKV